MSADGRLASALGLCSASVVLLERRLREQSALGHRAPGYKVARPPGRGRVCKEIRPGEEGGGASTELAGAGGAGERAVGGVNRRGSGGRRRGVLGDKADALAQLRAAAAPGDCEENKFEGLRWVLPLWVNLIQG